MEIIIKPGIVKNINHKEGCLPIARAIAYAPTEIIAIPTATIKNPTVSKICTTF